MQDIISKLDLGEFIDRFNASEILKENGITIENMINDLKRQIKP